MAQRALSRSASRIAGITEFPGLSIAVLPQGPLSQATARRSTTRSCACSVTAMRHRADLISCGDANAVRSMRPEAFKRRWSASSVGP